MCPPSSWPIGNRFSAVASRPNHAANAIGCMLMRVAVRQRAPDQPRGKLEEQRLAQLDQARDGSSGSLTMRDSAQPDEQRRHRDEEPGDRSGNADVEERDLRRESRERMRMNAPSVPVSGNGGRDEERARHVDAVSQAGEVVAHLVAAENRQDRHAVPQAVQVVRRRRRQPGSQAARSASDMASSWMKSIEKAA